MKKRSPFLMPLVIVLAIGLFAGCSDKNSTPAGANTTQNPLSDDDYALIAEDIGYTVADPETGLLTQWRDPMMTPDDGLPLDRRRDFSDLHDTTFTHHDITTTIDVTFYDAERNPSELYDPETSVRLDRSLTMAGAISDNHRRWAMTLQSFLTMDHILASDTVYVINEDGTSSESGTMHGWFDNTEHAWNSNHGWHSVNVNVHTDHEAHPYPLSGQIHHRTQMQKTMSHRGLERTVIVTVNSTITFDGTQWALVEMDDGSRYSINLDTGRCERRHRP